MTETTYERILRLAAEDTARKRDEAQAQPFTRNMARSGRTVDNVNRPTERDAVECIRRNKTVLFASYGQAPPVHKRSNADYITRLQEIHGKRCPGYGREPAHIVPVYDFGVDNSRRDGLDIYCRSCRAKMNATSYRRRAA